MEVKRLGTKGREIIKLDIKTLLEKLNKAFADEWLAYYQYWVGAKLVTGPMRGVVAGELEEHAGDELRHAGMLAERIIQLGGSPPIKPNDWYQLTNCGYEAPEDPYVEPILEQNIKGEQCAIKVYNELAEMTKDKDTITYHIALEILHDEIEHEEDLEAIMEDLKEMRKRFKK